MKVERDPRCPTHPQMQVYLCGLNGPLTWVCSVCMRELGIASLYAVMETVVRPPPGRRPKPSEAAWGKLDLDWIASRFPGALSQQGVCIRELSIEGIDALNEDLDRLEGLVTDAQEVVAKVSGLRRCQGEGGFWVQDEAGLRWDPCLGCPDCRQVA